MNRIELTFRQFVYTIQTADKIYVLATTSGKPFHVLADKDDLLCWAKIGKVDVQKGYRIARGYRKKGADSDKYDDLSGLFATIIVDENSTTTIYLQPARATGETK